jgi:hypothetical protein
MKFQQKMLLLWPFYSFPTSDLYTEWVDNKCICVNLSQNFPFFITAFQCWSIRFLAIFSRCISENFAQKFTHSW